MTATILRGFDDGGTSISTRETTPPFLIVLIFPFTWFLALIFIGFSSSWLQICTGPRLYRFHDRRMADPDTGRDSPSGGGLCDAHEPCGLRGPATLVLSGAPRATAGLCH